LPRTHARGLAANPMPSRKYATTRYTDAGNVRSPAATSDIRTTRPAAGHLCPTGLRSLPEASSRDNNSAPVMLILASSPNKPSRRQPECPRGPYLRGGYGSSECSGWEGVDVAEPENRLARARPRRPTRGASACRWSVPSSTVLASPSR
jgi:hypothetical protein